jgi:hypothetical protein
MILLFILLMKFYYPIGSKTSSIKAGTLYYLCLLVFQKQKQKQKQ